jgi:chromosome segregation ATPase
MRVLAVIIGFIVTVNGFTFKTSLDESDGEKPIQKVVRLLKEMQAELDKEADEDEDMMEKLGCWCHTNEKEKTKAIADAKNKLTELGASIEEFTAKSAQLKTDIENLKAEVAEKSSGLEESTSIREKESNEFYTSEKDSIQNIESVKGAVMTLSKTQEGAALPQEALIQVRNVLRKQHARMFRHKKQGISLLQKDDDYVDVNALLQESGESENHAPQSGAIFGILKQMKESMETDLKTSQSDEEKAKADYKEMYSDKSAEIASAKELIDAKFTELAETDEKNALSKQDLEDTTTALDADTKFLEELVPKCENSQAEYDARNKVRQQEIQAVSETIGILTDDDAKDLLLKFVQISTSTKLVSTRNRDRAAQLLSEKAKQLHRPQLSALATSMRNEAFAKVLENIGNMIAVLKKEQKDEVKQKDFCQKELHENEMQTTEKTNSKEDLEQTIADLESLSTTGKEEIAALNAEITEMQVEIKRASEIRVKQNSEFQMTVTDQVATQKILQKALGRLQQFYGKKAALLQRVAQKYQKSAAAGGVVAMIEGIIDESKDVAAKALTAENDASATYESFVSNSNEAIKALQADIVAKTEEMAKADVGIEKAKGDLAHTEADLLELASTATELHAQCDFVVKFFDIRQTKRAEEIEALVSAKAIFEGVKF